MLHLSTQIAGAVWLKLKLQHEACVAITVRYCSAQQCVLVSLPLHDHLVHAAWILLTLVPYAGGQLAAWLRVRYPDVIAGAISSSPTLLGAPGLGLVSQPVPLSCQTCKTAKCRAGSFCRGLLVPFEPYDADT